MEFGSAKTWCRKGHKGHKAELNNRLNLPFARARQAPALGNRKHKPSSLLLPLINFEKLVDEDRIYCHRYCTPCSLFVKY